MNYGVYLSTIKVISFDDPGKGSLYSSMFLLQCELDIQKKNSKLIKALYYLAESERYLSLFTIKVKLRIWSEPILFRYTYRTGIEVSKRDYHKYFPKDN